MAEAQRDRAVTANPALMRQLAAVKRLRSEDVPLTGFMEGFAGEEGAGGSVMDPGYARRKEAFKSGQLADIASMVPVSPMAVAKAPAQALAKTGKMADILRAGRAPGIPVASETGAILPRMADPRIPAEQTPIPRLTPLGQEPKPNERSIALLRSKKAAGSVDDLIAKGKAINPELENWYGSEPLRQFALNEGLSPEEFKRMMAQFSSASQRSPVLKENLLGSYMWGLDRRGEFSPQSQLFTKARAQELRGAPGVIALPEGMGSLAQSGIFDRAKRMSLGEAPEQVFGPKLNTYLANKMGNEVPVTIDVNALKGPVMSGRLAPWMKSLYKDDQTGRVLARPRADYEAGKLSMKEALQRPGMWEDAPATAGEYGAFENLWRRGAQRAGVSPAGAQALGWYGSAGVTGLRTEPQTYMQLLEQSARAAAARQGITPVEAMRRAVRGAPGGQLGFSTPKVAATMAGIGGVGAGGSLYKHFTKEKEKPKEEPKPRESSEEKRTEERLQKIEEAN